METYQIISLVPLAYLLLVAIPLSITDIRIQRIPNKVILPAIALWFVTSITSSVMSGEWWLTFVLPFVVAICLFIPFVYASVRGMLGMGDAKMFTAMGLALSPISMWYALALPIITLLLPLLFVGFTFLVGKGHELIGKRYPLAPYAFFTYAVIISVHAII